MCNLFLRVYLSNPLLPFLPVYLLSLPLLSLNPSSPSLSLHLCPLHPVCPFLCSLNLNYTWTKDEYKFDYYVGVCVAPVSTALDNCYVVQKTTKPDGGIIFQCLGGNLDVQVTNTQSEYILKQSLWCTLHTCCHGHIHM